MVSLAGNAVSDDVGDDSVPSLSPFVLVASDAGSVGDTESDVEVASGGETISAVDVASVEVPSTAPMSVLGVAVSPPALAGKGAGL